MTPAQEERHPIDAFLAPAGWQVCGPNQADLHAHRGAAIREFPLKPVHGFADDLLYGDGKAAGVIEAKKRGITLTGVETQSEKYTKGLPPGLPCWRNPLAFSYRSTGIETRFTNGLDPDPRTRNVFAFHRPETLVEWLCCHPPLQGGGAGVSQSTALRPWSRPGLHAVPWTDWGGDGFRISAFPDPRASYELGTFQHCTDPVRVIGVTQWHKPLRPSPQAYTRGG